MKDLNEIEGVLERRRQCVIKRFVIPNCSHHFENYERLENDKKIEVSKVLAEYQTITKFRAAEFIRIRNAVDKQKNITKLCYEKVSKNLRSFFDENKNVLSFRYLTPIFLPMLAFLLTFWKGDCSCIGVLIFYSALLFLCFACDTAISNAGIRLECFEKKISNNELFILEK